MFNLIALAVATGNSEEIAETITTTDNIWAMENSFLIILSIILVLILIAFASRINRLEDAIKNINERFDGLSGTLIEISKRPCQISSTLGYCVYYTKNKKEVIDNSELIRYDKTEENAEEHKEEES